MADLCSVTGSGIPHQHAQESTTRWFPWIIAILTLAPFLPLLAPNDRVFNINVYCDYAKYNLPVREFVRDELLHGRFPLWIPWVGCGMPLHASQQATVCYPFLTPLILLFPVNWGIRLSLFLHLALCFFGQYRLARSLGISRPAASFAAIVPTQSAHMIAQIMSGHVNHVIAFCLMPLFLLVLTSHLRRATSVSTLLLAIMGTLLIFSGHPQPPYYVVMTGTMWAVGSLVLGEGSRQRLKCVGLAALAVIIAILLGAVQLLPTVELFRDNAGGSGRGTAQFAGTFALDLVDLFHLFLPNLRGNPFVGIPDYPSYYLFHERAGYVGFAPLILSLYALTRSSIKRWEWAAASLMALFIVIALGNSTPLFGLLGKLIPGLHLFRCPGRILGLFSIFSGLLAARGLDAAVSHVPIAPRRHLLLFAAIVWCAGNGVVYASLTGPTRFDWSGHADFAAKYLVGPIVTAIHCLLATVIVTGICQRFGRSAPKLSYCLMLAVLLIDLGLNNAVNFHLQEPLVKSMPTKLLRIDPPIRFVARQTGGEFSFDELRYSTSVEVAIANHRSMLGLNDGGVLPRATEQLFQAVASNKQPALLASACNYEYLPQEKLWTRIVDVLPRCRFVPAAQVQHLEIPLSNLRIEDCLRESQPSRLAIVQETSQLIEVDCESADSGVVVLSDMIYPGWICTVDGMETPMRTVHGVFRGVDVGRGPHRIRFAYQPQSFQWGCIGFALGSAFIAIVIFIEIFRSRTVRQGLAASAAPGGHRETPVVSA